MPKVTEEHERQRREEILAGALTCFARSGFRATSIEDIVRESKLSVGAIYSYFPSKEELFLALAAKHTTETLKAFQAIYERPGPLAEKNRDAVELFFQQMAAGLESYCRVSFEFWSEAPKSGPLQAERARLCDSIRQFLVWALTEARAAGELREDVDVTAAAELILALDDGILLHHVSGVQPIEIENLKQTYIALLDSGLASAGRSLVAAADAEPVLVVGGHSQAREGGLS